MGRIAPLLLILACGSRQPAPQRDPQDPCADTCNNTGTTAALRNDCGNCRRLEAPWLMTCEERCSFESEWYAGCLAACRQNSRESGRWMLQPPLDAGAAAGSAAD